MTNEMGMGGSGSESEKEGVRECMKGMDESVREGVKEGGYESA